MNTIFNIINVNSSCLGNPKPHLCFRVRILFHKIRHALYEKGPSLTFVSDLISLYFDNVCTRSVNNCQHPVLGGLGAKVCIWCCVVAHVVMLGVNI